MLGRKVRAQELIPLAALAHVDLHDPDIIIAVEIVGDECGVGFMTKALRQRYPFVKVP